MYYQMFNFFFLGYIISILQIELKKKKNNDFLLKNI